MKEIWKDIPGYEGLYQVSNLGRVKSLARVDRRGWRRKEKFLSAPINGSGYRALNLYKDGIRTNIRVHQLVAMAFLGYIMDGYSTDIVDHINEDKLDNRVSNLQLVTTRVNVSRSVKNKSSKYTGVCFVKKRNKWQAQIKYVGDNIFLGYYNCETKAYLAYMKAIKDILCVR